MGMDWIQAAAPGGLLAIVGGLLSWWKASAKSEVRAETDGKRAEEIRLADGKRAEELRAADSKRAEELRAEFKELKEQWWAGIERVQLLSDNITRLQSSQNEVNAYHTKALEAVVDKCDRHESILADHTATLRLLVDKVMAK